MWRKQPPQMHSLVCSMSRYEKWNPNPKGKNVGDCTVRAISRATGRDWESVYAALTGLGFIMADMPSANHVWGAYLRRQGFKRYIVDADEDVYTVDDFARDHETGVYVLALQGHVVCVDNGKYYDTWDSGKEIPLYYWER